MLSNFITNRYCPFLERCVYYRYATAAFFLAMLIVTVGLLMSGTLRFVFFPNIPSDFMQADVVMVEGTADEATNQATQLVEQALLEVDNAYFAEHGQHVVKHSLAFYNGVARGQIFVELAKGETREIDGFEIVKLWREKVPEIPGVKNMQFQASTNGGAGDISFQLKSKSLSQLTGAAEELKQVLAEFNGVYDVKDSLSGGNDEIVLKLKPEAEILGLTLADLARQVRYGFYGAEAQRVQRDGEEVKVMVRYPKDERHSLGNLENMRIRTASGDEVPFSTVATFVTQPSFSTITRVNGERSITISAAIDKSSTTPAEVVKDMQERVIPDILAHYAQVDSALEGASKEEKEAVVGIVKALLFALFTIYALMAIPLKSYVQPLIIMVVIPFGFIGAVVGHLVLGLSVSMLSVFGIVALAGVNDKGMNCKTASSY